MMIPVCLLADLPPGEAFRLELDPPVAVFHTEDGDVLAIDDTCTHQDASLSDGWLEGCRVECPLHASTFDLRTGAVDAPPARLPVRTHQVVIEDGMVHVLLSDAPPNLPPCAAARPAVTSPAVTSPAVMSPAVTSAALPSSPMAPLAGSGA